MQQEHWENCLFGTKKRCVVIQSTKICCFLNQMLVVSTKILLSQQNFYWPNQNFLGKQEISVDCVGTKRFFVPTKLFLLVKEDIKISIHKEIRMQTCISTTFSSSTWKFISFIREELLARAIMQIFQVFWVKIDIYEKNGVTRFE